MKSELICITCPMGCRLSISGRPDEPIVEGNKCKRGIAYAKDELTNPIRMICSTVKISGGIHTIVPVKTDRAIPEKYKFQIMKLINGVEVQSPVEMGDVVLENVFDTGVNVVVTRNM
ncbi:MAG: DUF1667 domain-containing protein [Spirochaetales bacterium]|nr:DUF1667 domain-containing protein [Spirochaetales bacterium]